MPGLDLLRIVAGLGLLVCHAGFWLAPFRLRDTLWMLIGHACVELFLLAFGFLLAQAALRAPRPPAVARSWGRVAIRIWPLYVLFLLCNLALWGDRGPQPSWLAYLTLTQNLAWPHPEFFGEAWIVAAALMTGLVVPVACRFLHGRRFATGLAWLLGLLLITNALRGLLVVAGDPLFDSGVRKILLSRLDLPFYGILLGWLWIHRYAALMRWRGLLALLSLGLLAATSAIHMLVPLDSSIAARVLLFPLCDIAWIALLPWACSLVVAEPVAGMAKGLAASAYAGLLTHVTALRLAQAKGLPLVAHQPLVGVLALSSFVLLATGVALLVWLALDRPLLDLRERRLARLAEHSLPVAERR